MSRLQSIATGIATLIALVVVGMSIDFAKLASSFEDLRAVPFATAVVLLVGNFMFAFLRFKWTLGALDVKIERRSAAYAFALGNLASQFLLNIIGQSLTRAVVLQASGVPMSATVAATYLERLIALATIGLGAAASALVLFGSFGFEVHDGGAYFLSIALAGSSVFAFAGVPGLKTAIGSSELRKMLRTIARLFPAVAISLAAHLLMFGAYLVLVRAFVPGVDLAKLAPAIVIVMFAAGVPISWAGWGLREFGAVYALGVIGVPNEAAVVIAVVVGAVTMFIAFAAGGLVVIDSWLRPIVRPGAGRDRGSVAGALAPSDPILLWTLGILCACFIYFQLRIPSGAGELTINAADPFAITALFFAAIFAATGRSTVILPRYVLWSVGAVAAALALGTVTAWMGPGVTKWALLNRMLGFLFLIGYAAVPALVVMIAGERGRSILASTFVRGAVVICVIQALAFLFNHVVRPLPPDFFGYLFAESGQLEGYAQNSNAFAFQLLMTLSVLIAGRSARALPGGRLLSSALLLTLIGLSRSRAGMLCALGALVVAGVLHVTPVRALMSRRVLTVGLVALAAITVVGVESWGTIETLIVEPFNHALRPHAGESDALRWQSVVLGLQAWQQHPVVGGGLGTFLLNREAAGLPAVVIHSTPVWFMAEMGVVGLAAYLVFVVSLIVCGFSALLRHEACSHGLLVAVAVFAVMGLVHDLFFQRTFWFAVGLLIARSGTGNTAAGSQLSTERILGQPA
jgi:hypothetical protein